MFCFPPEVETEALSTEVELKNKSTVIVVEIEALSTAVELIFRPTECHCGCYGGAVK